MSDFGDNSIRMSVNEEPMWAYGRKPSGELSSFVIQEGSAYVTEEGVVTKFAFPVTTGQCIDVLLRRDAVQHRDGSDWAEALGAGLVEIVVDVGMRRQITSQLKHSGAVAVPWQRSLIASFAGRVLGPQIAKMCDYSAQEVRKLLGGGERESDLAYFTLDGQKMFTSLTTRPMPIRLNTSLPLISNDWLLNLDLSPDFRDKLSLDLIDVSWVNARN